MHVREKSFPIIATVAAVLIAVVVGVGILAWIAQGAPDETAVRQKLSELGVLATLASNGQQIASVNFTTIKDKGRYKEGLELALGLKEVASLSLNGMPVTNADLVEIGKLRSLASLSLSDCPVGGEGLDSLADLKNLETLYLNQTKVIDEDLKDLRYFQKLTAIDLSNSAIGQELGPLAELPKLKLIVLSGVSLIDGSLRQIGSSESLTRLSLVDAEYAESDLQALKEMLPTLVVDE